MKKKNLFLVYCLMSFIPVVVIQMFCVTHIAELVSAKNDIQLLLGLTALCLWVACNIVALNLLYSKFRKLIIEEKESSINQTQK